LPIMGIGKSTPLDILSPPPPSALKRGGSVA
jgi:hypothetical protein